jgi:hypothetical protein
MIIYSASIDDDNTLPTEPKAAAPEDLELNKRKEEFKQYFEYQAQSTIPNSLLHASASTINRNAILASGFNFISHFLQPNVHVQKDGNFAIPSVTYVNSEGKIITVFLQLTKKDKIKPTEVKWKTTLDSSTQKFLGGINNFTLNNESHTSVICGNKIIIRNNKTHKEIQLDMKYEIKSQPHIKVIDKDNILIMFQDMKNSIICCKFNVKSNDKYFTENPSVINAITKYDTVFLEHNGTLFFSDGNEIRIFNINNKNATLAEIASTHIGQANSQELITHPFIKNDKIHFWIKNGDLLHLKTIQGIDIKDVYSYNMHEIIQITQQKSKDMSNFSRVTFIDENHMIIYNDTSAILLSYHDKKIYFAPLNQQENQQNAKSNKIISISANKNIIYISTYRENKILDINAIINGNEYAMEKNIIKTNDSSNRVLLNLFPIIIFSNHQLVSMYLHETEKLQVSPIDISNIKNSISSII